MTRHRERPSLRVSPGPLTEVERLERKLARARAQRNTRTGQYQRAVRQIHALERRRAWVESYLGFRVEYRLRGIYRRVRRIVRWHVLRYVPGTESHRRGRA